MLIFICSSASSDAIEDDEDIDDEDADDNEEAASEKSAETTASVDEKEIDDRQLVMDKHFVLPKRSTRSSRIIKPNKRLLEVGGICSKKNPSDAIGKPKPKNYFGLGDFASEAHASSSSSAATALSQKLGKETFASFATAKVNSSFVLRQPRLQFQTDKSGSFVSAKPTLPTTTLLPASSSAITSANVLSFGALNNANSGMRVTVLIDSPAQLDSIYNAAVASASTCAVCSAPVNNKDAPLARKYGVIACEVCRKFNSRMTKISKLSTPMHSNSSSSAAQSGQQLKCTDGKQFIKSLLCQKSLNTISHHNRWQLQHIIAQEPAKELQEAVQGALQGVLA